MPSRAVEIQFLLSVLRAHIGVNMLYLLYEFVDAVYDCFILYA
jgi:hypothetical protein